jgi:hypothetical protein
MGCSQLDFLTLYTRFQSPVTASDCGDRCAPYNEMGVPYCCDTRHTVPAAYRAEWNYLRTKSNMWRQWEGRNREETLRLRLETPDEQALIACLGYKLCRRQFRSIVCRAFPFFPYVTNQGKFIGLTYYWEYEDRCWVINHLEAVTTQFMSEFITTFDEILETIHQERVDYRYHSSKMRRSFGAQHRTIPLFHRDGYFYLVTPNNGQIRRASTKNLPRFGPYKIAEEMPFPGEIGSLLIDSDTQ